MIDSGQETRFKYFGEEILDQEMDAEEWRPFLQTLWARGTRQGFEDALEYLDERSDEGFIDAKQKQALRDLCFKFRTYR